MNSIRRFLIAACLILPVGVVFASPALAHERRTVGAIGFRVGWQVEPTYSGVRNAVQLFLTDPINNNNPITDLGDTLKVQVISGGQTSDPMSLKAASGATGEYDAPLLPTRPGTYTFHFTGTVHDQKIDESFTSSSTTFDNVNDATAIEFPAKDPTTGDLATKLDRLDPRIAAVQTSADQGVKVAKSHASSAKSLAVVGIVVGLLGLAAGLFGVMLAREARRQSRREASPAA